MPDMTATLRTLQPYPGIFAYYDGRITGKRLHSDQTNWLDDGAYSLGIASYAIVDGREALVYDTHMSLSHARAIRTHLEGLGVTSIRVVLSHWHTDHIAGNEVFSDCEIIALGLTAELLAANREKLERRDPPIFPVVIPTRTFEKSLELAVGGRRIELHHFDIHSADGNIIWLPDEKLLLAGDTLEDPITYISEAAHIATHIAELERMRTWPINRILPSHGAEARIAAGGYAPSLIDANRSYLQRLADPAERARAETLSLKTFVADDLASGAIGYFEPYEAVHRKNVAAVDAAAGTV
ncbi:MBL fold metallo-hydrolase [Rhizobiaceae bacterium n13]|uniref:MBL fold metallo-hydrolase n=1 Tax=Ferirhizobium litorale TaxID=2927786 RepID=A0AAE3U300_9HYPH|nr:MBL fold metallo-hydrolase [Fererhizobium litorale]MDI7863799.1 MBL fold metallo-hydrolase [Fererhizobium litorale]MDI7924101.1 MBL fold metallo-hydrolase [Fererhizobium litorale]